MRQTLHKIMSAVAFAEAGEYETARSLLSGGESYEKAVNAAPSNAIGVSERAQQYMEAITFAEGGEHEYARQTLHGVAPSAAQSEAKTILVLGSEDTFPDYLVNYALDMAERFQYEILAVNALPMSRKTRILSGFAEEIGEHFQQNALSSGNAFARKAEERGVPFGHEVKLMSEEKALRQIHREKEHIEFVLTEPENTQEEETAKCAGSVCVCEFVG